ncbi:MAG: SDR family oxidoreductase [Candidatus Latescibacteria bacterium]|jgi:NAD(P)-dependent dehydrogenase (short-subunit alcohol dehydrogenase family)|nr:SDR family oxidoreductase [Candidatus Latescibacterota bacterium]MBT4140784.1 SDR family oxidoreductase [Candidatus Latescibacterota bacterium]
MNTQLSQATKNPVAIITGAGQGMGKSVAHTLAQQGLQIAVNDIHFDAANATVAELHASNFNAIAVAGDVTNKTDVQNMMQQTIDYFGAIHILINNAGILYPSKVIDISEEEWDRVIDVNLKGTFLCSQAVLPAMQQNSWGRIVNFSSTAGKNISTVGGAHYTAAKAGILGFTRHLAKEVAQHNITVNSVCPGLIDTDMVRNTIDPGHQKAYANSFPISRLGKPEEVADLVAFLCSDKAAYITGASLDINGGDLMI